MGTQAEIDWSVYLPPEHMPRVSPDDTIMKVGQIWACRSRDSNAAAVVRIHRFGVPIILARRDVVGADMGFFDGAPYGCKAILVQNADEDRPRSTLELWGVSPVRALQCGDNLAAYDDATVGLPRPGAPIFGVVVGRDGPHVVVACRGSKLSFVVADGLSVEGLPQIEKPSPDVRRGLCGCETCTDVPDPTPPIGEDIATMAAGTFSNLMGKPLDIGSAIWRALGPLTEAEIFAAQLANDAEREAPALFPEWSRAPRSQSQTIGAGLGVWGTRDAKPAVEAKPYPQIDETDLLPDA